MTTSFTLEHIEYESLLMQSSRFPVNSVSEQAEDLDDTILT